MDYLPLFFELSKKPILIIGGGSIALRKARLAHNAGAILHVVALDIKAELLELVQQSGGEFRQGSYKTDDLQSKFLIIAATDNDELNKKVSEDAHQQHIPVNVVDNPSLCSVILPAIIDRSPLVVAVSSGGQSPVLARMLRTKIESSIPASYGRLAKLVGGARDRVKEKIVDIDERKNFWEDVLEGPAAEMMFSGNPKAAEDILNQALDSYEKTSTGEVYLVGAGPGDPDLLTFKALRLMQKADVVLYDRLVSTPILDLTRRDAEKIYVGKARADHAVPQENINQLLVDFAQQGKRVLRLKGGDPFIFGRGGEELEELAAQKIPFQIVPGITAASGCSSYAGIPLTHRDHAQSVRFVTGHLKSGGLDLPWDELAQPHQTLVFYMGLMGLELICKQLIAHGRNASTPAAIIQQGTTPTQKVIVSNLAELARKVAEQQLKAPTLLIIGEVVSLREKLAWFEQSKKETKV